jgi:hypothetical protein
VSRDSDCWNKVLAGGWSDVGLSWWRNACWNGHAGQGVKVQVNSALLVHSARAPSDHTPLTHRHRPDGGEDDDHLVMCSCMLVFKPN